LNSLNPSQPADSRSNALVAWLLACFALLAGGYAVCVAASLLPFNSGSWVVGDAVASRGWIAYLLSALLHLTAALGLWRNGRWAHWLAIALLALGLMPAFLGISSAVVDLRVSRIALWGTMIVLRSAALYLLMRRGK
jgi:hypothetical protein